MTAIALDRNQVPAHLRAGYAGRALAAILTTTVDVPMDAGLWSGGSRCVYHFVRLSDGASVASPGQNLFHEGRKAYRLDLPHGVAMVRHSIFRGRDHGLTFYIRPDDAAPLLPPPSTDDLSADAAIVARLIACLIPRARREYAAREGITAARYDAAVAELKAAGLCAANGGLTTKGKNTATNLPRVAGY